MVLVRNLIVRRNVRGFSDGPYVLSGVRLKVFNQRYTFPSAEAVDDSKDGDFVVPVNADVKWREDVKEVRLLALDRNDFDSCYFTVEPAGQGRVNPDGDMCVFFQVHGPCICFSLQCEGSDSDE